MSINQFKEKIKGVLASKRDELLVSGIIILVGFGSFGLGKLSVLEQKNTAPIKIISSNSASVIDAKTSNNQKGSYDTEQKTQAIPGVSSNTSEMVVASKSGSKYHFPWCSGAKRISEKNKITFNTIEEAKRAGYTPASNCKGLK